MGFRALLALADRAALQHLGGPVRYTSGAGAVVDVSGIFDAAYVRQVAGQPGVTSFGPAVFLRVAGLPSDPETDLTATITVEGVFYSIQEPKKDGLGGVVLQLNEV